jgi:hypothetical protein
MREKKSSCQSIETQEDLQTYREIMWVVKREVKNTKNEAWDKMLEDSFGCNQS